MKRELWIAFCLGLLWQTGFSQNIDKTKLDRYFEVLEQNDRFMGSVAVAIDGKLVYTNAIGFADIKNNIKVNEGAQYRIGSISKTFTAVLTLKAVEEGKLDLNQTIGKYFPAIENAESITVKHLLYHRSGIHNFTNDADYLTWNTEAKTEKEMVGIIVKGGSDFEPDTKMGYSNSNYVLLSYLLEKCFHMPYADLLEKYIVEPIGLKNTYLGGGAMNGECSSYRYRGGWESVPATDMSIPVGAGGVISTPVDLVKFSAALFHGQLLNAKSLAEMKNIKDNFGMGLVQIPFYDKRGYGFSGGIDGFSAVFSYFPEENLAYALTSNGTRYNNNNVSIAVLSAVYNKPYDIPVFTSFEVSAEDLKKYLGTYASSQIPLKITITQADKTLIAQATGQPSFPLEATEEDKFKFDQAGVVLEFNPEEKTMILKQGGGQFAFQNE